MCSEEALEKVLEAERGERGEGSEDEGPGVVLGQAQARVRQHFHRVAQHVHKAGGYDDTCAEAF